MSRNIGTIDQSSMAYDQRAENSPLVDGFSEVTAGRYREIAQHFRRDAKALVQQEYQITKDIGLSPIGRQAPVKVEVQKFIDGLGWLKKEQNDIATQIGGGYGELFVLKPSSRPDQGVRDIEIRSMIWPLPTAQRNIAYLKASQEDRTEVMLALKDSPLQLVQDEAMARGDDERAQRVQPEVYKRFVENGGLLNEVNAILQDAYDLGVAYQIAVPSSDDGLGLKVRLAVDFAIEHFSEHANTEGKIALRPENMAAVGQG